LQQHGAKSARKNRSNPTIPAPPPDLGLAASAPEPAPQCAIPGDGSAVSANGADQNVIISHVRKFVGDHAFELVLRVAQTFGHGHRGCLGFCPWRRHSAQLPELRTASDRQVRFCGEALHHRVEPRQLFRETGRAPLGAKQSCPRKKYANAFVQIAIPKPRVHYFLLEHSRLPDAGWASTSAGETGMTLGLGNCDLHECVRIIFLGQVACSRAARGLFRGEELPRLFAVMERLAAKRTCRFRTSVRNIQKLRRMAFATGRNPRHASVAVTARSVATLE